MPIGASFGDKEPGFFHDMDITALISVGIGLRSKKTKESECEYIKSIQRRVHYYITKKNIKPRSFSIMAAGELQRWNFHYFARNVSDSKENNIPVLSDKQLKSIVTERDILLTHSLPKKADLLLHKNAYLITKDPQSLFYINPKGNVEELAITSPDTIQEIMEMKNISIGDKITSFKDHELIAQCAEKLISSNKGHSLLNQFTSAEALSQLLAKEFSPFAIEAENNYIEEIASALIFPKLATKINGWGQRDKSQSEELLAAVDERYKTNTLFARLTEDTITDFLSDEKIILINQAFDRIKGLNPKLAHLSGMAVFRISSRHFLFEEYVWFKILFNTAVLYPNKMPTLLKAIIETKQNFHWVKISFKQKSDLDDVNEMYYLYSDKPHFSSDKLTPCNKHVSFFVTQKSPTHFITDEKPAREMSLQRTKSCPTNYLTENRSGGVMNLFFQLVKFTSSVTSPEQDKGVLLDETVVARKKIYVV